MDSNREHFKIPLPTYSEQLLFDALVSSGIVPQRKIFWYTENDRYTPDLVLGNLIIEVDGKIHERPDRRTLDRIRQRALENMGYHVRRVGNERVQSTEERGKVVQEILQEYFQRKNEAKEKRIVLVDPPLLKSRLPRGLQEFVRSRQSCIQKGGMHLFSETT